MAMFSLEFDTSFPPEILKAYNFNRLQDRESGILTKCSVIKSSLSV